jgi:hypothetical protein
MKDVGSIYNVFFLSAISLTVLVAIGVTANKYWFDKEYPFLTEASCNPETENCFYRSCFEEGDYCPPNQFEHYRQFIVSAKDFPICLDNYCLEECITGVIACEERKCGEREEDECVGPTGSIIEEELHQQEQPPEENELFE